MNLSINNTFNTTSRTEPSREEELTNAALRHKLFNIGPARLPVFLHIPRQAHMCLREVPESTSHYTNFRSP
jgi:hypothetical protein